MISLRFMLSFQFACPERAMLSIWCFRVSWASTVFALWISLKSRSARIVNEDNRWVSGSCKRWKAKSTDLFVLHVDNGSLISSFTMVAVRYLQFAGSEYFSPHSVNESCDNSPVKILFTRPAIFSSPSGDFLLFGSNAWVRLSRKSLFVPSSWRDFGLWPLLESSNWFVAVVQSSKLGVSSVMASFSSSFGSGCRRIYSLRLLNASVWAFKVGRAV